MHVCVTQIHVDLDDNCKWCNSHYWFAGVFLSIPQLLPGGLQSVQVWPGRGLWRHTRSRESDWLILWTNGTWTYSQLLMTSYTQLCHAISLFMENYTPAATDSDWLLTYSDITLYVFTATTGSNSARRRIDPVRALHIRRDEQLLWLLSTLHNTDIRRRLNITCSLYL